MMMTIFVVFLLVYILTCLALIGFILTQEGKGGGLSGVMGASMGETFGFGGATTTIRKFTSVAATIFLVLTIALTFLGERVVRRGSSALFGDAPAATAPAVETLPDATVPVSGGNTAANSVTIPATTGDATAPPANSTGDAPAAGTNSAPATDAAAPPAPTPAP